jgi:hypothetical protein
METQPALRLTSSPGTLRSGSQERQNPSAADQSSNLIAIGPEPLAQNDVQELRRLWEEEFGEPLSVEEAHQLASRLLDLYVLLYQPPQGNHGSNMLQSAS